MKTIFLTNKYSRWYFNIIENATSLRRKKLKKTDKNYTYFELHHIIPRSLGGLNHNSNFVLLTPREHYVCHLLLTKMCRDESLYKMLCAFNRITNRNKNKEVRNSRLYASLRDQFSKKQSERYKGSNNNFFGKEHTNETKAHLSKVCPRSGEKNGNFGKSLSQKQKDAISNSNKKRYKEGALLPPPPQYGETNYFSKLYKITDPLGNTFVIKCMKTFCEKSNLCSRTMIKYRNKGTIPTLEFERPYRVKNMQSKRNCEGYSVSTIDIP